MWGSSPKVPYMDPEFEEPLLEENKGSTGHLGLSKSPPRRRGYGLLFHAFVLICYSAIFLSSWLHLRSGYTYSPSLIYDPARKAIRHETQVFDHTQVFFNSTPKPYSGVPGPGKDAAWEELLKNFNIRVTEDEMRRLGKLEHNLPLPDGGYFGSLTVFHQLHCIWRVQTALYPKYYWSDLTEEEAFLNLGHSEHCLDVLRQSIMCNADTSMITMKWDKHSPAPIADSKNLHECVNWDTINNWAAERAFDAFEPGYLIHPTLGEAFADERASRIGVAVSSENKHFDHEKIKEILKYSSL